jgi:hypothetical protein
MNAVTQDQAYNMRAALASGYDKKVWVKKERKTYVKLTLGEGDFNLIHSLLKRIQDGELIEQAA